MKQLIPHIERLLTVNDFVIVPGLGGFALQRKAAQRNPGSITPPVVSAGFNPLLVHSDGLLEIELMHRKDYTYHQAAQVIENEVESAKNLLKNGVEISVGALGTLFEKKGQIIFAPAEKMDFLPENFALNPVPLSPLKKNRKTSAFSKTMRYAASIALVFGLTVASPLFERQRQEASFTRFARLEQSANEIAINTENTNKNEEIVAENQSIDVQNTTMQAEEKGTFHLIVACFSQAENAERYLELLHSNGFPEARAIDGGAKSKKIAVASYFSQNEAADALKILQTKNAEHRNAWIWEEKNQ